VTRTTLFCLLAAFVEVSTFIIAQNSSARAPEQPFLATIQAESPAIRNGEERYTLKVGSELFITAHLTNLSQHNLSFGYDKDSRTGVTFPHRYEVRTRQGNAAPRRTISHPELGSTGHGWSDRVLKPGESMDISGDYVSRIYDLSQPGEYRIQLFQAISDDPKDGFVKSNAITVVVTK
jgi:hypothetical protein